MQVARTRRRQTPRSSLAGRLSRPARIAIAGVATVAVAGGGLAAASTTRFGHNQVGTTYANGEQVAANQIIKPLGQHVVTPYGKFMGSTVSPDGRFLAATSADRSVALQVFDLQTHKLVFRAGTASGVDLKLSSVSVGQEGPTWSPDGQYLWLPLDTSLVRLTVNADGTMGSPTSLALPDVNKNNALPGKGAYSPNGKTLYMPLNGQNTVVAIDPATMAVTHTWNVGIAPRQVLFIGRTLYVSNEGGRQALPGETTINSYNTDVPANAFLGTSTTGTVSVINTAKPAAAVGTIKVGLHPTALYNSGGVLFVANTNSDTVSVVDTAKRKVVQTIATQPYSGSKVGYYPTGITMSNDGHLLVTLGRANAVAVYRYGGSAQEPMSLIGLLPTDYYPMNVANVGGQIVVTNTRGIDALGPAVTINKGANTTPATGHGTHSTTASLTWFTMPTEKVVRQQTSVVFDQNGWNKSGDVKKAAVNSSVKAVAVPTKIGNPSTIKHVFLLVKENRTYDQVYGDMSQGNGNASYAQFGAVVTPNQHKLATQFGLYDNIYDIGTNSAEGHNWLMQGDNPAYTESSVGQYIRSYDTEDDVLGHQRSGFLWTSAMQAGNTVRNFGEFLQFETKPAGATWQKYYCAADSVMKGGDAAQLTSPSLLTDNQSPIPSLNAVTVHNYPKFDTNIPDTYRYLMWKQDFEKNGPANLNMFWLSSDHTGGAPDPRAQVADNDLAVGKIVETISHSKYWKDSAIFVVEDDSQDGVDHVDGHRAPVQVISPYAKHGAVISDFNSQINMVRTIQQILGANPLNQKLAAATPMYDAFTNTPDYTPYTAVPNQVPLTENVSPLPSCGADPVGGSSASASPSASASASTSPSASASTSSSASPSSTPSASVSASASSTPTASTTASATTSATASATASTSTTPGSVAALQAAWKTWQSKQAFSTGTTQDSANPELMNRFTWYQTHNFTTPYPGDSKVYLPSEVPGAAIPGSDGGQ